MNTMYISGKEKMNRIEEWIVIKYLKYKVTKCDCIVIGNNIKENKRLYKKIEDMNLPISDGRWLFKYLVFHILEYICKCQKRKIENLKVSFITSNNDELITFYIKELIKTVKSLKIITAHRERFHNLEEELYLQEGIVLEISNNRKKALLDSEIIFNFDADSEKLNKYRINDKGIIVNLKDKINIKSKKFSGINASFYDIEINNRLINYLEWRNRFKLIELYESSIFQKNKPEVIIQNINNDRLRIKELIGFRGKIFEEEYQNCT